MFYTSKMERLNEEVDVYPIKQVYKIEDQVDENDWVAKSKKRLNICSRVLEFNEIHLDNSDHIPRIDLYVDPKQSRNKSSNEEYLYSTGTFKLNDDTYNRFFDVLQETFNLRNKKLRKCKRVFVHIRYTSEGIKLNVLINNKDYVFKVAQNGEKLNAFIKELADQVIDNKESKKSFTLCHRGYNIKDFQFPQYDRTYRMRGYGKAKKIVKGEGPFECIDLRFPCEFVAIESIADNDLSNDNVSMVHLRTLQSVFSKTGAKIPIPVYMMKSILEKFEQMYNQIAVMNYDIEALGEDWKLRRCCWIQDNLNYIDRYILSDDYIRKYEKENKPSNVTEKFIKALIEKLNVPREPYDYVTLESLLAQL